jgi:Putative prokaryotic signal transducing protein
MCRPHPALRPHQCRYSGGKLLETQWLDGVALRFPRPEVLDFRADQCALHGKSLESIGLGYLAEEGMAHAGSADREERPNPNEKLVRVFDTEQESEAMVVRGLLESAGIDSDVTSLYAPQDTFPGVGGTIILVREEDAEEARRLIEEYRRSPDEAETAEMKAFEEPPDKD